MSFGTRLKEKRESLNITQPQLAEMLGVSKGAIGNWETDVNSPRATLLYDLFDILHCDANYLFQDEMRDLKYKDKSTPEEFENIIKKYRDLDDHGQKLVDMVLDAESERCKNPPPAAIVEFSSEVAPRTHLMEYFRSASAGSGVFILGNEATSKIVISEDDWRSNGDYVISVTGDSMIPAYNDGDKVIVSQRAEVLHGDVGIFVVNGSAYIKKYGENELISLNPEADNIKISEYDNIVCMGKVIGKIEGEYEIIND